MNGCLVYRVSVRARVFAVRSEQIAPHSLAVSRHKTTTCTSFMLRTTEDGIQKIDPKIERVLSCLLRRFVPASSLVGLSASGETYAESRLRATRPMCFWDRRSTNEHGLIIVFDVRWHEMSYAKRTDNDGGFTMLRDSTLPIRPTSTLHKHERRLRKNGSTNVD